MGGHLKFVYEVLNWTGAKQVALNRNHAEPNQRLHHQIAVWDLRSSEILHNVEW